MKAINNISRNSFLFSLLGIALLVFVLGCEREDKDLRPATFPNTAEVFIDGFSAGLEYAAFGDSKVTAFTVDENVSFENVIGTSSMRFDVPNEGDAEGSYAGGVFRDLGGRDLSGYDALTFYAKATKAATVNLIGFGNDFMADKYSTTTSIRVSTSWNKFIIPIPDPSKLTREKGLLVIAEGPEDGDGYSIWLDVVKFEKLGTLAHPRPAIMNGKDITTKTYIGVTSMVTGLTQTMNLPNGTDQTVNPTPSYFEFTSSDTTIAKVSELGLVSVVGQGTAKITATLAGEEAAGSLTIESLGDFTHAPVPDRDAADVISIFSDAYTNVPVDFYNGFFEPFQRTLGGADLEINGDKIIKYTQLNFVATEFKNPTVNASEMTHFHVDIQIENPIEAGDFVTIQLGDFGPDGIFGTDDDVSGSVKFTTSPPLASNQWISLDIPFSDFAGLTQRANLAQIFFITDGSVPELPGTITDILVDNMYFYKDGNGGGSTEPTEAAPTPPARDAADVISIFSDAYTNITGIDLNPAWGQSTQVSEVDVAGDNTLKYANFNFQGTDFSGNAQDVSSMQFLHVDMWTTDATDVKVTPINSAGSPAESLQGLTPITSGQWVSYDIPLTSFTASGMSLDQVIQLKFDGQAGATPSNIFLDNIYFYKEGGGTEPATAAPTPPVRDAADVISVYSDAYTDISGTNFNPGWGQSTVVSEVSIEGNNAQLYTGLDYQGIQLGSSQDVSGMEFLHIDYWTVNSSALNSFLISTGPVEKAKALAVPTVGWNSVDIPLTDFSSVNLADVIQLKFDGNGDIYLDNIYFYTSAGGANEPSEAAPTPPARDAADVISLFSSAYSNETVDTWSADWDDSEVADVQIAGDDVKKYTFTNFAGIDFSSNKLDASGMTNFHMDIWTPDEVLNKSMSIKNVDFGGGSAEASSHILTVTHTVNGDIPALAQGSWVSIDVPISAFTGDLTRSDLAQMVITCNLQTVYIDNIYFYKSAGGTCEDPTVAPPTPAQDAADVISVFSDAYTDIANTNFNPGWGQSTVVTTETIGGGSTLKYDIFNFQGTNLGGTDGVDQDLSSMEYLHIDMWTCDATVVQVTPISRTTGEKLVSLTPISNGQWNSYDIPLSDFNGVSMADIYQMKFDGQAGTSPSKIFVDNIYFYKTSGGACEDPTAAPPTPAQDAADVISVFSDAYTDIANTNFNPGWGQSTVVTTETIGGGSTLKYDIFNFQGTNLGGADGVDQDLSSMEYLHIDMWTCDATVVQVTPISRTTGEKLVSLTPISNGQWNSYDIPLSDFSGISMTDIYQMKFDGQAGTSPSKIFVDNIYFYKGSGGSAGPTEAAPTPPVRDAANVVSIYSDAYTDIAFDNFDAGWCGGAAVTGVTIAGNNTLKKNSGIDCHGIDFSTNRQDLSSFTHIHFDFYTDDTDLVGDVFNVKLVDFAGGAGEASALEVNINTGTTPGIQAGVWVSVDVDITSLGGVVTGNLTRSDIAQFGITTANLTNVWYDNIYLYK